MVALVLHNVELRRPRESAGVGSELSTKTETGGKISERKHW